MNDYQAVVRLRVGGIITYKIEAFNIRDVAKEIRSKHKLWGRNPHAGFVIREVFVL